MASGKAHDKSTKEWTVPFAVLIGLLFDPKSGLISGTTFLIGGLWLSPDLDTNSLAIKRWGILKGLWWPYRKMIPHRSIFSHGPFLGTTLRVSYLITLCILFLFLIQPLQFANALEAAHFISDLIKAHPKNSFFAFLGLEASVWLHLIKDGDPMPQEWFKRRQR